MRTFQQKNKYHVASRIHRIDRRQQSRCSLALIMLMGLATVSVVATTQAVSAQGTQAAHIFSRR